MSWSELGGAYLFAYLFWSGLGLGCLGLSMLRGLVGGRWSAELDGVLVAGREAIWVLVLLFIPIVLATHVLYPWDDAATIISDALVRHRRIYMNKPFFIGRAVLYFACWLWLVRGLARRNSTSAGGIVLYGFTASFASVDWLMSLEKHWYSTVFAMLIVVGQALSAMAFGIALVARKVARRSDGTVVLRDLGNLLLTLVMLWAYLAFMQYLIVWSGNLHEETEFFHKRVHEGWQWLGLALIVFQFSVPFFLLLFRGVKDRPRALITVSVVVLVMQAVHLFWLSAPAYSSEGLYVPSWECLALALVGLPWLLRVRSAL